MLVSELIEDVRNALHDSNGAVYRDREVNSVYNRSVTEVQSLLIMIGARAAASRASITGDGAAYSFDLPSDFMALVPETLRPRSPIDATSNYIYGIPLDLADDNDPDFTMSPTEVGTPTRARIVVTTDPMTVEFPCIPSSGYRFDYAYWPVLAKVTAGTEGDNYTPWEGRADRVLARNMELILRSGAEFVGEPRDKWLAEARASLGQIFGMNLHQRRVLNPSMFKGGAWLR